MKRLLFLLFLLVSLRGLAQEETSIDLQFFVTDNYLFPEEAPPFYLLADRVMLRECPSTTCKTLAQLGIAQRLVLLEQSENIDTLNGLSSRWYRVETPAGKGWLWGGFIAQYAFGSYADPDVKFLAGLEKNVRDENGRPIRYMQIRAVKNGKELQRLSVKTFSWGFGAVQQHGNKGLKNVDDILSIEVPCVGGCGCSTGEIIVFWSNQKLHHVADLMGSPDGAYSTNTRFIYPADMEGVRETLIRETYYYEDPDPNATEQPKKLKRRIQREFFNWDGSTLRPAARKPELRTYWMELE